MLQSWGAVLGAVAFVSLLGASCSSSDDGAAGTGGTAGTSNGGTRSGAGGSGGSSAHGGSLAAAGVAGEAVSAGGTNGGAAGEPMGGAAGAAGPPLSVVDVKCVRDSDCLAACNSNGWPKASCAGFEPQYCACSTPYSPTAPQPPKCVVGTTEGCPAGMQCEDGYSCVPSGTGMGDASCDNGDECAPGYICHLDEGTPPFGEYTWYCVRPCKSGQPLPPNCGFCTDADYCDPSAGGAAGTSG